MMDRRTQGVPVIGPIFELPYDSPFNFPGVSSTQ